MGLRPSPPSPLGRARSNQVLIDPCCHHPPPPPYQAKRRLSKKEEKEEEVTDNISSLQSQREEGGGGISLLERRDLSNRNPSLLAWSDERLLSRVP